MVEVAVLIDIRGERKKGDIDNCMDDGLLYEEWKD